jgi:hypothetical protein
MHDTWLLDGDDDRRVLTWWGSGMVEMMRGSVKLLEVPPNGHLPRASGFPTAGEAGGELIARTDVHGEWMSAAFEWAPGQESSHG